MTVEAIKKILLSVRPERPRSTERRKLQRAIDETFRLLDNYEALINQAEVTVYEDGATDKYSGKSRPIAMGQGCWKCSSHTTCFDAFQIHSHNCNHYDKTDEEFLMWIQDRKEKSGE